MEYEEIIARKSRLVEANVHPIPEQFMADLMKEYYENHYKSSSLYQQARNIFPGGLEHNLGLSKPFPLTMDCAQGARIWDVDGNEYVDYLMFGGPTILGSHFSPLDGKIVEIINEKGTGTGLTCEWEILAAQELIKHIPNVEMVRFLQSGTESVMAAIRIARVFTGKKKIIKFGGSYHGWSDQMLLSSDHPDQGRVNAMGIPSACLDQTIEVAPNDFAGLRKAFEESQSDGGVAAILAEATGGHAGTFPSHPQWNQYLRSLCDEFGALLIFDEVITGLRLGLGGAQEFYHVKADLIAMGKIIAHGYPSAGAVAGRKDVMSVCHPGGRDGAKAFVGGTLAANPISTAACYYAIQLIEQYNATQKASDYATRLTTSLNDLFSRRPDLAFFAYNIGSIIHVETSCPYGVSLKAPNGVEEYHKRKKIAQEYQIVLTSQGLIILGDSKRMYTCMQHDDVTFEKTLKAWDYLLSVIPVVQA